MHRMITGFSDLGSAWRLANYEMDEQLIRIVDTLYEDIKPLYQQLHTFVRNKLIDAYPGRDINSTGPIPAHILGNCMVIIQGTQ
jgi:peptidyl-dipeptidase A